MLRKFSAILAGSVAGFALTLSAANATPIAFASGDLTLDLNLKTGVSANHELDAGPYTVTAKSTAYTIIPGGTSEDFALSLCGSGSSACAPSSPIASPDSTITFGNSVSDLNSLAIGSGTSWGTFSAFDVLAGPSEAGGEIYYVYGLFTTGSEWADPGAIIGDLPNANFHTATGCAEDDPLVDFQCPMEVWTLNNINPGSDLAANNLTAIQVTFFAYTATSIPNTAPEPATLALLGSGLAGLGMLRRRKKPKA